MEGNKENNKEKKIVLWILLLILIIIIIFLLIRSFGRIDHNYLIPTGNVDIFDINFGKDNCNCACNNCNYSCSNNSKPVNGEVTNNNDSDDKSNDVIVYDKDLVYSNNTKLNIFTQTSYHIVNDKIAPTSENSYQFVIRNNNDFNIKYNLEMIETNKYNINMKFRLKLNGKYVVGSDGKYVTASELNQYDMFLAGNKYDVYTLDWKWFESSNDTEIGTNIKSNYKLDLKITASAS